jgi:hypothetical protein
MREETSAVLVVPALDLGVEEDATKVQLSGPRLGRRR